MLKEIRNCMNCPHYKWEEDWGDIYICNMKQIIAEKDFEPEESIHSKCPLVGEEITYKWIRE